MSERKTTARIELATNSVLTVEPSLAFPGKRLSLRFAEYTTWSSFGIELSADQARQLAAALVAQADALEVATHAAIVQAQNASEGGKA